MAWGLSPKAVLGDSNSGLRVLAEVSLPESLPVAVHETAVVALECPRTAALCFDRIWSIEASEIPDEIRFNGRSDAELVAALSLSVPIPEQVAQSDIAALVQAFRRKCLDDLPEGAMRILVALWYGGSLVQDPDEIQQGNAVRGFTRTICEGATQALGKTVLPIFASERKRDEEYTLGDREVVVAALRELEVVDEESLTWEQVLEFRRDVAARADYRRLVHWLDAAMVGRSRNFVVDEIAIRVERYRDAVRKHGLKSRLGVLASLLDAKALVGSAVAAGGSLVAGEPLWGLMAASSFLFGKALLTVGQARIDLGDVHETHNEIAFVAEVNKRLTEIASGE